MRSHRLILTVIAAALLAVGSLAAQRSEPTEQTAGRGLPIERLLNPDGSVNMRSGYRGRLDVRGWNMMLDHSGAPRFVRSAEASGAVTGMARGSVPGDENWSRVVAQGAIDGEVLAIAASGRDVYIGGTFTTVDMIPTGHLARWDGSEWHAIGEGKDNGTDGFVYAIAVDGDQVYVGGQFTRAGTVDASNIARWSRSTQGWSAMGEGIHGGEPTFVAALAIIGGDLYAGGSFRRAGSVDASNVARWNAAARQWSAIGTAAANGTDGEVLALAAQGDSLFIGGSYGHAGGLAVDNIVAWNPAAGRWSPLADGIRGYVDAIAPMGGHIYVGGLFDAGDDYPFANVASWLGEGWRTLSTGVTAPPPFGVFGAVRALCAGPGQVWGVDTSVLYLGGEFQAGVPGDMTSAVVRLNRVARWVGETNIGFASLGFGRENGVDGFVNAIAATDDAVYVAGQFDLVGRKAASRVARWSNGAWSALGTGIGGPIQSLAVSGGAVYAAAPFTASGVDRGLGRLENGRWKAFADSINGEVMAVAVSGDDLYIGGQFSSVGSVGAINIARWNKSTGRWSTLSDAGGVGGGVGSYVAALAVDGADIVAGGRFTIAGDGAARNIARWTRATDTWSALGGGIDGTVYAVAAAGRDLYVGGEFLNAGGARAVNVAHWDGGSWSALDSGVGGRVNAIAISSGGDVYVGGRFTKAGTLAAGNIARWSPAARSWSNMEGGLAGPGFPFVQTIAVRGDEVYVGGDFARAGSVDAGYAAVWDSNGWHALGSGADNIVRSIVVDGTSVYVGGDFLSTGGKPSYYFAKWK